MPYSRCYAVCSWRDGFIQHGGETCIQVNTSKAVRVARQNLLFRDCCSQNVQWGKDIDQMQASTTSLFHVHYLSMEWTLKSSCLETVFMPENISTIFRKLSSTHLKCGPWMDVEDRAARAMGLCQTLVSTFFQSWLKRSGESTSGTSNPSTWPHTGKLWNVNYLKLNFRICCLARATLVSSVKPVLKLLTEDMLKPSNEDTTLTSDIKHKNVQGSTGEVWTSCLTKI